MTQPVCAAVPMLPTPRYMSWKSSVIHHRQRTRSRDSPLAAVLPRASSREPRPRQIRRDFGREKQKGREKGSLSRTPRRVPSRLRARGTVVLARVRPITITRLPGGTHFDFFLRECPGCKEVRLTPHTTLDCHTLLLLLPLPPGGSAPLKYTQRGTALPSSWTRRRCS